MHFFNFFDFRFRQIKVNEIIRHFIWADLALLAGWGLIEPVFAIFILERIAGATLITIGIAAAIYWIVKSALQVPIALMLDKTDGEKDDYYVLIFGLCLAGLTAFGFALINEIWQLYLVKVLHAAAFALYIPALYSIFSNHLDKGHRSREFSLDSTAIGIAAGINGFFGSILVKYFGFVTIFIIAGVMCLISASIIFFSPEMIYPNSHTDGSVKLGGRRRVKLSWRRRRGGAILGDHTPKNINK